MTHQEIVSLIEGDEWMIGVLQTARELRMPDWFIGAGFVRNKVWDFLHEFSEPNAGMSGVDLVYFDPRGTINAPTPTFHRICAGGQALTGKSSIRPMRIHGPVFHHID